MAIDLKKEIKLSDLFGRGSKGENGASEKPAKAPKAAKAPKQPKEPKEPKERRAFLKRKPKSHPVEPVEPKGRRSLFTRRPRSDSAEPVEPKEALELPPVPLMRAFNLLPREDIRQRETKVGMLQVGVALGGLLLFAALGALYLFGTAGAAEKRNSYDELRLELASLAVPEKAPSPQDEAALATEQTQRTTALSSALANRIAFDRLLREFSLVLPEDVWLDTLQITTPGAAGSNGGLGNTFVITGMTTEQSTVGELLARLSVVPDLASVTLLTSEASNEATGLVTFTISATIRREGAA